MFTGPEITTATALLRARSRLRPSVPHSARTWHENEHGRYRADCAGYVSMAWSLAADADVPDPVTVSEPITKPEIRPGDVLVRVVPRHHVAIFEQWTDATRHTFWGLEQRPGLGTVRRRIRYPYENSSRHFHPHRYLNIRD